MNLIQFLKKYSNVDNHFIDDFFGMYSTHEKYNFCINLESVADWLGMSKGNIKKTLIRSYKKNTDYIIKSANNKAVNGGGHNKELILITPKCFKLISMNSNSKKSHQVREFYYQLEELVDQYKDHIISSMNDKIDSLKNNQKPKVSLSKGVIYVIEINKSGYDDEFDSSSYYKIGKTENLANRMNGYNSDKLDDVEPVYIAECSDVDAVESCIKSFLKDKQYRKKKEIYQVDLNTIKYLFDACHKTSYNLKTIYSNSLIQNKHIMQKGGNYGILIQRDTN